MTKSKIRCIYEEPSFEVGKEWKYKIINGLERRIEVVNMVIVPMY
jgi:hypothetical protein